MERTSTTFEELESQMMSSYTDAFEEAGGVHEVQAQLPEVNLGSSGLERLLF